MKSYQSTPNIFFSLQTKSGKKLLGLGPNSTVYLKNKFASHELGTRQITSNTRLPQIQAKSKKLQESKVVKFTQSKLSKLGGAERILRIDQKMVEQVKNSFRIQPTTKVIHDSNLMSEIRKNMVVKNKYRKILKKQRKVQKFQNLLMGELQGWHIHTLEADQKATKTEMQEQRYQS